MSADDIKQAIANQLKNLEEKSGIKLEEWKLIIENSGLSKHGELVNMLKEKYSMGHGNANTLVHFAKQTRSTDVDNEDVLITEQYKGKEHMKPWYDNLVKQIQSFGSDVELSPKKAYVSVRRKKQFAIIQPSIKTRMDIGLNIKDTPADGKLEAAGSWNAMCTHRIKIEDEKDIDKDVISWLKKAYELAS